jgi:fructose-1,6-bisphosphatase/inositol monophosphatase family enzyme
LSRLAHSELKNCELIAEEDTPSAKLFAKKSKYVLTLDPIDGTKLYATGQNMLSVIVTIHDKKKPIYTFCYYPAVDWGIKIVGKDLEYLGKKPTISTVSKMPEKVIGYWNRPTKLGPEKRDPKIYKKLTDEGYVFIDGDYISDESGIKAVLGKRARF